MLYNPPHFRQTETDVLIAALADHPFGALVSNGAQGPVITHLPLFYDADGGPLGRLIGHVAKANPHWSKADLATPSVAVFHGPDAYISPGWYASKKEHGKVVPTWNYAVIHAVGTLRVHEDAEWLRAAVTRLTNRHEAGRATPWAVTDAPEDFIRAQLKGIVGIELVLTSIEGKAKLSQNRNEADRAGVLEGLAADQSAGSVAMRTMMAGK